MLPLVSIPNIVETYSPFNCKARPELIRRDDQIIIVTPLIEKVDKDEEK